MHTTALARDPIEPPARLATRAELTAFLMHMTTGLRADSYMLVGTVQKRGGNEAHVLASNWIHDAIELVGRRRIAGLAQVSVATQHGGKLFSIRASEAPALPEVLDGESARLLDVLGHGEIYPLKVNAGRQPLVLLLSTAIPGRIDESGLGKAQMECGYALSQVPDLLAAVAARDPLSERERECLFWVSEGKTTDDVAIILGVSSNTVNSYLTHAIQKLSASNRAMAIATAIRSGIL